MINFKEFSKSSGYKKLKKAVLSDTYGRYERTGRCFSIMGCKLKQYKCFHAYCSKFKYIIDLVRKCNHETGIPEIIILDTWENARTSWYMNYYQTYNYKYLKELAIKSWTSMSNK